MAQSGSLNQKVQQVDRVNFGVQFLARACARANWTFRELKFEHNCKTVCLCDFQHN